MPPFPGAEIAAAAPGQLAGTGKPGSRVQIAIQAAGKPLPPLLADVDTNGKWQVPLPALTPGQVSIQVLPVDASGVVKSNTGMPLELTSVTGPVLSTLFDGAQVGAGGAEIGGRGEPNSSVRINDGNRSVATAIVDGAGNWRAKLPALTPGAHQIRVSAVGPNGRVGAGPLESGVAAAGSQGVDVSVVPSPLGPSIAPGLNGLTSPFGGVQTLYGRAEPGSKISVYSEDRLLGTATADAFGNWQVVPPVLPAGLNPIVAKTTAPNGKELESPPVVIAVASPTASALAALSQAAAAAPTRTPAPPAAATPGVTATAAATGTAVAVTPVVTARPLTTAVESVLSQPAGGLPTISMPPYPGREVMSTAPGQLTGTGKPGSRVQIAIQASGRPLTPLLADVDAGGKWQAQLPELAPGAVTIQVLPVDANGVVRTNSGAPLELTSVDGPVLTTLYDGAQVGASGALVGGRGEPSGGVRIYDGNKAVVDAKADGAGNWQARLPALAPGEHQLKIAPLASNGRPGTSRTAVTVSVVPTPTGPSIAPTLNSIDVPFGAVQTLYGRAEPSSTVSVYSGNNLLGTATTDAFGNWQLVPPVLPAGKNTIVAKTTGQDGKEVASTPADITVAPPNAASAAAFGPAVIAAVVPVAPVATATPPVSATATTTSTAVGLTPPTITPPRSNRVAAGGVLRGTGEPDSTVAIYDGGQEVDLVTVNSGGTWRYPIPPTTKRGLHEISVAPVAEDGSVGPISQTIRVTVVGVPGLPVTGGLEERQSGLLLLAGMALIALAMARRRLRLF